MASALNDLNQSLKRNHGKPVLEMEIFESKPVTLHLKNEVVSPTQVKRLLNLACLATPKSCDTTKQSVCGWQCIYIYIYGVLWRCPWCNGYCRRKWTRRHEFKSWTRLITFHIALIPVGKVWIQLFSLHLWVNSRADRLFSLGEATSVGEEKLWIQTC